MFWANTHDKIIPFMPMSHKRKLLFLHLRDIHDSTIPPYFSYIDINYNPGQNLLRQKLKIQ